MGEHLTPDLKAKARPEYFAWNALLRAKHVKSRLAVRRIDDGPLDIHSGPCAKQVRSELFELLRKVMPDISKISGGAIVVKGKSGGFFLEEILVVFKRPKNR